MSRVICGLLLVLWGGGYAHAQNAYTNQMDAIKSRSLNGLTGPRSDLAGTTEDTDLGSLESSRLSQKDSCFFGFCVPGLTSEDTMPGRREVPLGEALSGSLSGMTDLQTGFEMPEMGQANMGSLHNAYKTTLYLTESAVAAGLTNAFQETAAMAQSIELGHLNTLVTGLLDEDMRPFIKAYRWCIQRELESGGTRYQAMEACRENRPVFDGVGAVMYPFGSMNAGGTTSLGFDLGSDRDHTIDPSNAAMSLSGDPNPYRLRLTDIIFNQEGALSGFVTDMVQFKLSFRALYGDILWDVDTPNGGLFPRRGGYEVETPTSTISTVLRDRTVARLDALSSLMNSYCVEKSTLALTGRSAMWEAVASDASVPNSDIQVISVPGFPLRRSHYNLFMDLLDDNLGATPDVGDCVLVAPPGGWDIILSGSALFDPESVHGKMYKYAYGLTLLEAVVMGDLGYRSIENLSIGSKSMTHYQDAAKGLIFRALGISEEESSRVFQDMALRLSSWIDDESAKLRKRMGEKQRAVSGALAE